MDTNCDGSATALHSVMKWKTVLAVFIVVMLYLVCGGLAFSALEQPFESSQKTTITHEKALFLEKHPCVTPDELEALIKVSPINAQVVGEGFHFLQGDGLGLGLGFSVHLDLKKENQIIDHR